MNKTWGKEAKLAILERAAADPAGIYEDGTPPTGFCYDLSLAGLLEIVKPETFFGGTYRITDAGMAFVKMHSVPAEW